MRGRAEPAEEDPRLRAWMADYQSGSVDAFERLHDAVAPDLRAYLGALARDPARADDLVQETFLQLHRSRAAHTPGEPVRPWLFAVARRVFLMDCRGRERRARHERRSATLAGPPHRTSEDERLHARRTMAAVLPQVPSHGRRAFVLHHLFGLTFREIGARLGVAVGTAKIRSSRAASLMRALLGGSRDE